MLEETLSSITYSPAEAALAFISFLEVELAVGGPNAESRFFKLFSMLCDRVFGPMDPTQEAFKHEVGSWLSRQAKWERPNTSLQATSRPGQGYNIPHRPPGTSTNTSLRSDPVIKLLGVQAITKSSSASSSSSSSSSNVDQRHPLTLIEAITKEAEHRPNVRYPFPFHALPKPTQEAWLALIEAALGVVRRPLDATEAPTPPSDNVTRLLGSLLKVKPLEQKSLLQFQQQKVLTQKKDNQRPLQLSPMSFHSPSPMSPMAPSFSTINNTTTTNSSSTPSKDKDSQTINVYLSMLEYYLMLFIRYPTASPPPASQKGNSTSSSSTSSSSSSSSQARSIPSSHISVPAKRAEPYGDTVYYQLYQEYINYYVPNSLPQGNSNNTVAPKPLTRGAELFVRITVELWLECPNQLWPTNKAIKSYQNRHGVAVGGMLPMLDLNASYDLVKSKYDAPPSQVTRCLHKLVARAISDGTLLDMAKDLHAGYRGSIPDTLCLTPTMTILQLPFYNYVRNAFRNASIHTSYSPFYAALNDWLVWLEPWNTRYEYGNKLQPQRLMNTVSGHGSTGSANASSRVTYPRGSQRSMYTEHWEPYIASNLYLYVVPLAIFLRRSRELDFSPRDYQRSLNTVHRVFRVFSPQVVDVINKLLKKQGGSKYTSMVSRHEALLGTYAPPGMEKGLSACRDDMQNLLEEIYIQHLKKVEGFDFISRTIASIGNVFGGGPYAGETKELEIVLEKAKTIVGFPKEWEVAPPKNRSSSDSQGNGLDALNGGDRDRNGYFSEMGRRRIAVGASKCDPFEIGYVGDRMRSHPQSHEIAFLVPKLIDLADKINAALGLPVSISSDEMVDSYFSSFPRRFNFRFFADIRNLVFLFLCFIPWLLFTRKK